MPERLNDPAAIAAAWSHIKSLPVPDLRDLFTRAGAAGRPGAGGRRAALRFFQDPPDRLCGRRFCGAGAGVDFAGKRAAMFNGEAINVTEGPRGRAHRRARRRQPRQRRGRGGCTSIACASSSMRSRPARSARSAISCMSASADRRWGRTCWSVRSRAGKPGATTWRSSPNVDGVALETAMAGFDPHATLLVIAIQDLHHHRDDAQCREPRSTG